jgi:hypothetical protein
MLLLDAGLSASDECAEANSRLAMITVNFVGVEFIEVPPC